MAKKRRKRRRAKRGTVALFSGDPVLRYHLANARRSARKWGVPVEVILAVLKQEGGTDSKGRPVAPGDGAGPPSYAQATYGTGRSHGIKYGNSASEVDFVAKYLVELGYKSNPKRAIGAYNGGPGNPQMDYAASVLSIAEDYRKKLAGLPAGYATPGSDTSSVAGGLGGGGDSALFGEPERDGALKALVWVAFVLGGFAIAGLGVSRITGLKVTPSPSPIAVKGAGA